MKQFTYNVSTLSSGLRLLHIPFEEAASVYVSMAGKVGRRAEHVTEVGAAHFLEHLFFDGTPRYPSSTALARLIDGHGAQHNGSTDIALVDYYTHSLPEKAEACVDFVSDIFQNSLLREPDIEKERKVIREEALAAKDDPHAFLWYEFVEYLYPDQALGRTFFAEEENLPNINHQVLETYMRRNYSAENFVLCIAGNISHEEAHRLGETYFKKIHRGQATVFDTPKFRKEGGVKFLHRPGAQAKLRIGFQGFDHYKPEAEMATVLGGILGGLASSRLFIKLRDELHLVYGIGASHTDLSDTGYFSIVTSLQEDKMQQAVNEIFSEIKRLMQNGITDEELETVKNSVRTGMAFNVEKVGTHANSAIEDLLLHGAIPQPKDELEKILRITKADVQHVAQTIFADAPKIVALTESVDSLAVPSLR